MLYISKSTIPKADQKTAIDEIVTAAHARNPGMGLTGALLFTGTYFAQVLEGNEATVDALMATIYLDERHEDVKIVDYGPIKARRFPDWSMAYHGPSQFVAQHVTRLLDGPQPTEQRRASEWLNELLWEFAAGSSAR